MTSPSTFSPALNFSSTLVLGALLGEDQTALLVLLLENKSLDLVAQVDELRGINILADGELATGDDTLALEADVQQNLIVLDLDDGARHQIALVEGSNGAVDELVHLLVGHFIQRKDGRVLNLTQRWTPFEQRGPDRSDRCRVASLAPSDLRCGLCSFGNLHCYRGPTDKVREDSHENSRKG